MNKPLRWLRYAFIKDTLIKRGNSEERRVYQVVIISHRFLVYYIDLVKLLSLKD